MKQPIDLEAIRSADTELAQLLEEHPELREFNNGRQQALEVWLEDLDNPDATPCLPRGTRSHSRITT